MEDKSRSVNFKYKFSEDYNPLYVNGAYGGVSPRGEIIVNFYFERNPVPYEEKVQINETDEIVTETKPEDHLANVIRYVPTGVVMNLESAKSLHEWLGEHIEILEQEK
ncbi:hypothetical protein WMZ97_17485 [Lentibacillus sp. N15]|uniref:hypothetical protein n=1 Tax=Lentibacillus songyuanensis TaxID=3136161 RepID=UPI0031BAF53C